MITGPPPKFHGTRDILRAPAPGPSARRDAPAQLTSIEYPRRGRRTSYDQLMTVPDLGTDVFTELGRVAWAAVVLEDYVSGLCSFIDPSNPREDRRSVGQKITAARKVMHSWSGSATREEADAWLEHARSAVERRNAALHATPLVWVEPGRQDRPEWLFLGEMPRNGRLYVERPLTVESLAELRSVLIAATEGWRDLVIAVSSERERQTAKSAPSPRG